MMNSFGAQAADFAYVVLTNIKNEERKGEYLSSPEPKLKEIMALCKGKVLFIDNEAEPKRVEEMAKNIIQAIVKESQFNYYKHECFSQVAQLMKKMGKKEADIQNVDRRKEMVEDDGFLSSLMGFVKKLAPIAGVISPLAGVIGTAVSSIASMFSK
ncbi:hypothetical protein DPMN_118005 [Dreissena polymorpha]|uniref:AIG1-type G domain-containing protein n=2 Tax=Dreissena polymorpha TaxID=45954 RepID=A0A9D4GFY7_DREPO|nr:hypothetical protein DPMN_118005 [Dreissena polymorpha]